MDPPEWLNLTGYRVPVSIERAKVNSLAERFRKPDGMRTYVGFWVDDDLQIELEDIEFGFQVFTELCAARGSSGTHQIVGFSNRHVVKDGTGAEHYTYEQDTYSLVLTNSAFMDVTMLKWFWSADSRIEESLAFVDAHMNCEDILMNCRYSTSSLW